MMPLGVLIAASLIAFGIAAILIGTNKFTRWHNMRKARK
jgi:hypothetical protein